MNFFTFLFVVLYYLYVVERIVIGRFLNEYSLDTCGIKESIFGNGYVSHIWNTKNQESEYMHVINTSYYHYLLVRQLKSYKYIYLLFLMIFRSGNHSYKRRRADNYNQNTKLYHSDVKRYVECRLGVGGLANKMFGLVSSFAIAALLNATLICITVLLRSTFSSI